MALHHTQKANRRKTGHFRAARAFDGSRGLPHNSSGDPVMSDALQFDPSAASSRPDSGDAHSQIEQLLLIGLDHYFAGRYEQAIHVWTRVLFVDRGHARARAYIERARGALSERQRESEELLHHGVDAFHRGEASAARELLTSAVDRGAPEDEALAVLGRLDRLEAAGLPSAFEPPARPVRRRPARPSPSSDEARRRLVWPWVLVAVALSLAVATLAVVAFGDQVGRWFLFEEVERAAVPVATAEQGLAVPSAAEAALARARAAAARARLGGDGLAPADADLLREAMRTLDAIKLGDPLRLEADALRAEIQRELLAGVDRQVAGAPGSVGNPR